MQCGQLDDRVKVCEYKLAGEVHAEPQRVIVTQEAPRTVVIPTASRFPLTGDISPGTLSPRAPPPAPFVIPSTTQISTVPTLSTASSVNRMQSVGTLPTAATGPEYLLSATSGFST